MAETISELEARLAEAATDADKIAALNALGWALRLTETLRAFFLGEEAVRLAREADDSAGLAAGLCLQGSSAGLLFQHEEAHAALEEGLALSRRVGDRRTEARCRRAIGHGCYLLADYAGATENATASVQIYEDLQDWEGLSAGFILLGNIRLFLCDYGQALDWYTRALEVRERAGDESGAARVLNNIGLIYGRMSDHVQALAFHERSLDHAQRCGDINSQINLLCNLGGGYIALRRYEEALKVSRRAVALGENPENRSDVSVALTNMGLACARTGRGAEALEYFARALDLAHTLQDRDMAAVVLLHIGLTSADLGELVEARARLAEAAALAAFLGARGTALQAAEGLSEVCKRQGDYAAALGHYETFRRLEKEVFSEEAADRAKALVVKMEVEHHRHEAEVLAKINAALQFSNTALQEANARLEALATTDPLTGLPNHRALVAALDAEIARTCRESEPCALLFLDIDHFKKFNDTYGHSVGDAVLREFAACAQSCLRPDDTLGRWGGEEFLVLLPGTDLEGALQAGERVRSAVAGQLLADGLQVTCSLGAAACPPQEASRDALVSAADQALYAAKRLGRNQVRGAGDPAILALDGLPFSGTREAAPRTAQKTAFSEAAFRTAKLPG